MPRKAKQRVYRSEGSFSSGFLSFISIDFTLALLANLFYIK